MQQTYDRAAEDIGNAIHLEHVNVCIPDQRLATLYYVAGLGLTRDPYLNVSDNNMWINVGRSQFHLPAGNPQVLRGHTGIVMEGRAALLERLASVRKKLDGTRFSFSEHNDFVEATCPWGNRVRCYEPDAARFGRIVLGFPYVEFDVPVGAAKGIAAFYREMIGAPADVANGDGTVARVKVGKDQQLLFRETDRALPDFDEHSEQYEIDRQYEWRQWSDSKALAMALQFIKALRATADEYDQLYAALETCDTNQIMQERDALRLRIKAVDEEHDKLQADREKMVQAYTVAEVDRDLWRKEGEFYKKMWAIRGKALSMPCLTCGSTEKEIRLKNGEIP